MKNHWFDFRAENGCESECYITIYWSIQMVVVTNIDTGQSVTNACEVIATELVRRYQLDPKRLMFIEHYPAEQRPTDGESYDLVTFRWDGKRFWNPEWVPVPADVFHTILGTVQ